MIKHKQDPVSFGVRFQTCTCGEMQKMNIGHKFGLIKS